MSTPKASQTKTLIVVHGNKYIDVYSNKEHAIKTVNVPDMISREGKLLFEELLTLRLPQHWSKIYSNGFLVIRDAIRDIKPADIQKRDYEVSILRSFNRIADGAGSMVRT